MSEFATKEQLQSLAAHVSNLVIQHLVSEQVISALLATHPNPRALIEILQATTPHTENPLLFSAGVSVMSKMSDKALVEREDADRVYGRKGKWKGPYASGEAHGGNVVDEYLYRDKDGQFYLRVERTDSKQFLQAHWDGKAWSLVPSANKGPSDNHLWAVTAATGRTIAVGYRFVGSGLGSLAPLILERCAP